MKTGVFVGLVTLDCIYQAARPLGANEKQVAEAVVLAAGGPATNAAVAFRALGDRAQMVGVLGQHPLSAVVRDDLRQHGVHLLDLMPEITLPPPFSSIVVTRGTGDRAVISRNTADRPVPPLPDPNLLIGADCLLVDGHQMAVGRSLALAAQRLGIPVIVDAGSWKPDFETLLPLATGVIASANFAPPGGETGLGAIAYLRSLGVPYCAVTQGSQPILYATPTTTGTLPVPQIQPVDTLGAGDIFHGAFCHAYTRGGDFLAALSQAAEVAAFACQFLGTRAWIQAWQARTANPGPMKD